MSSWWAKYHILIFFSSTRRSLEFLGLKMFGRFKQLKNFVDVQNIFVFFQLKIFQRKKGKLWHSALLNMHVPCSLTQSGYTNLMCTVLLLGMAVSIHKVGAWKFSVQKDLLFTTICTHTFLVYLDKCCDHLHVHVIAVYKFTVHGTLNCL